MNFKIDSDFDCLFCRSEKNIVWFTTYIFRQNKFMLTTYVLDARRNMYRVYGTWCKHQYIVCNAVDPNCMTPTVELNALAMKRSLPVEYRPIDPHSHFQYPVPLNPPVFGPPYSDPRLVELIVCYIRVNS